MPRRKRIKGKISPKVKATDFTVEFGLHFSYPMFEKKGLLTL